MLHLPRVFLRRFTTYPARSISITKHWIYRAQGLGTSTTEDDKSKVLSFKRIKLTMKQHALLICDIQEGFRNAIHEFPIVINTARKLLQSAAPLQIPVIATAQNASRLGHTVPEVSTVFPDPGPTGLLLPELDKTLFSMALPSVLAALKSANVTSVAICGIESHVCVLQTCLGLLKSGFEVYAISDGISSCNKEEVPIAIARMRQEGVRVTTSESWVFEVMGDASRPEFKEVLKVVKVTKDSTKEGLGRLCKSSL